MRYPLFLEAPFELPQAAGTGSPLSRMILFTRDQLIYHRLTVCCLYR